MNSENGRGYGEMRFFLNVSNTRWLTFGVVPSIDPGMSMPIFDIFVSIDGHKQTPMFIGNITEFNILLDELKNNNEIKNHCENRIQLRNPQTTIVQPKYVISKEMYSQNSYPYYKIMQRVGGNTISLGITSIEQLLKFETEMLDVVCQHYILYKVMVTEQFAATITELKRMSNVFEKSNLLTLVNSGNTNLSGEFLIQTISSFETLVREFFYINI